MTNISVNNPKLIISNTPSKPIVNSSSSNDLKKQLNDIVNNSGLLTVQAGASVDNLITAIGKYIYDEQGKGKLSDKQLKLIAQIYLLLKQNRNSNPKESVFTQFERNNRYAYDGTKILENRRDAIKGSKHRTETAWTSYLKDVLAFESGNRGDEEFDINDIFKYLNTDNTSDNKAKRRALRHLGSVVKKEETNDELVSHFHNKKVLERALKTLEVGAKRKEDETAKAKQDLTTFEMGKKKKAFDTLKEKRYHQKNMQRAETFHKYRQYQKALLVLRTFKQLKQQRNSAFPPESHLANVNCDGLGLVYTSSPIKQGYINSLLSPNVLINSQPVLSNFLNTGFSEENIENNRMIGSQSCPQLRTGTDSTTKMPMIYDSSRKNNKGNGFKKRKPRNTPNYLSPTTASLKKRRGVFENLGGEPWFPNSTYAGDRLTGEIGRTKYSHSVT
jgi:hypothetical protein